jgi:hypothetical protein
MRRDDLTRVLRRHQRHIPALVRPHDRVPVTEGEGVLEHLGHHDAKSLTSATFAAASSPSRSSCAAVAHPRGIDRSTTLDTTGPRGSSAPAARTATSRHATYPTPPAAAAHPADSPTADPARTAATEPRRLPRPRRRQRIRRRQAQRRRATPDTGSPTRRARNRFSNCTSHHPGTARRLRVDRHDATTLGARRCASGPPCGASQSHRTPPRHSGTRTPGRQPSRRRSCGPIFGASLPITVPDRDSRRRAFKMCDANSDPPSWDNWPPRTAVWNRSSAATIAVGRFVHHSNGRFADAF